MRELLKEYLTEKKNGFLWSGRVREVVAYEKWSIWESWLYTTNWLRRFSQVKPPPPLLEVLPCKLYRYAKLQRNGFVAFWSDKSSGFGELSHTSPPDILSSKFPSSLSGSWHSDANLTIPHAKILEFFSLVCLPFLLATLQNFQVRPLHVAC